MSDGLSFISKIIIFSYKDVWILYLYQKIIELDMAYNVLVDFFILDILEAQLIALTYQNLKFKI